MESTIPVTTGHPKKRKRNRWGTWLFYAALLLAVLHGGLKALLLQGLLALGLFRADLPANTAGTAPAPFFRYSDSSGRLFSTADLKGKVVFLNFWASWCPPCRAELPSLQELQQRYRNDQRIVFLFLTDEGDLKKAQAYLREEGLSVPLFITRGAVPDALFTGTLPTTVVLDRQGAIVYRKEGLAGYHHAGFFRQLEALF